MGITGKLGAWLGESGDAKYTPLDPSPGHEGAGVTHPRDAALKKNYDRRILRVLSVIAGVLVLLSLLLAFG